MADDLAETDASERVVYLDHNATTPVLREVADAVNAAMRDAWGNPSSSHAHGRRARLATEEARARVAALRDRLADRLRRGIEGLAIHGDRAERLPNTLSVRFPHTSGNAILAAASDVAASTGSACHADGEAASSVILAMGVPAAQALGTVRLSLGRGTTLDHIERAAISLSRAWASVTGGSG